MKRFHLWRFRPTWRLGALALVAATSWLPGHAAAICVGDCGGDGRVGIADVQACVNLSIAMAAPPCAAADPDKNGQVSPSEVTACIQSFLDPSNCPMVPTPAPTSTSPPNTNTPVPVNTATQTRTTAPTNTPVATSTRTATNTSAPTGTATAVPTATRTGTVTSTLTPIPPTATATPVATCPLAAGIYNVVQGGGGSLTTDGLAPFPFPTGGAIVQHVSAASPPDCIHDVVIPYPGGFQSPIFCVPGLNFSVQVTQTGCGVGRIDSNGHSDFTVKEVGDTSDSQICHNTQACMNAVDSKLRVDVTVGDGVDDGCAPNADAIVSIPVHTRSWLHIPVVPCPDPTGPGGMGDTDTLVVDQVLDFTTSTNSADWKDLDGDGCCLTGAGPGTGGPGSVNGSCSTAGTSPTFAGLTATGACLNLAAKTVTTAASGPIGSNGAPLFDLTFTTLLNNTVDGPHGPPTASCASPPAINFTPGTTTTRCN